MPAPRFLCGVNYWPRGKGMDLWKAFEPDEIADDFQRLKRLQAHAISLPLVWEDFQPRQEVVSQVALRQLDAVFDLAKTFGLKVMPVLLAGHQSGVNWVPQWALEDEEDPDDPLPRRVSVGMRTRRRMRDIYSDPGMLRAQVMLVREVVARYRTHPALWGWTVGSEVGRLVEPKSRDAFWLWNALIAGEVKRLDPRHHALFGMGAEDLLRDRIRPEDVSEPEDVVGVRCREMGPDPQEVVFLASLAWHLSLRRVVVTEAGRPMAPPGADSRFETFYEGNHHRTGLLASESQAAEYLTAVLTGLWRIGAAGAFVYCYADAEPGMFGRPPFDERIVERTYGLIRADGSEKPAAEAFRAFARKRREVQVPDEEIFGGLTAPQYYQAPDEHFRALLAEFTG
ncbi:MAG: beta-galactosidase [Candidatus Sericytochromatia bacterium]|uniref:Beta-galactosidase n=1 Tax=Candidatus Tanganyikabacteria bacterium TaxID=2961651 RepID=A0A937X4H6_9BACT|nr:beta-galactosidase [Candidatus Tanganyikabacteria bacterium]